MSSSGSSQPSIGPGPAWVRAAVFYQVFPDRFASSARVPKPGAMEPWEAPPTIHGFKGGDLLGIAEHLDDLGSLGVTAIYLCPIFASGSNHRYTTYDYEVVDPILGGDAALRELLDEAHRRGMRIVLDGVFNHTGRGFWPFHHVLENGAGSPYRDWFHLDPELLAGRRQLNAYPRESDIEAILRIRNEHGLPLTNSADPANVSAAVEPGLPSRHVLGYKAWWDHAGLPKLNLSNPAAREYIFGIVERWLRFGIDGWRLDAPEEIAEPGFWEELRRRARRVNPKAYLVGEIWTAAPEWLQGDRFDGLMNYPLAEAILSFTGSGRLDRELLARTHQYAQNVRDIGGAEFRRRLDGVMATYPPDVTSLQLNLLDSHDTPRIISLAGGDAATVRLSNLILMTLPGAPCIYYGDEVGLEGNEDPDCRRGFPWEPAKQDTALREFIIGLIGVRKSHPVLRHGRFETLAGEGSAVAFGMFDGGGPAGAAGGEGIVVAVNAGDDRARLRVDVPSFAGCTVRQIRWPGLEWRTGFGSTSLEMGTLEIELEPREGLVVEAIRG